MRRSEVSVGTRALLVACLTLFLIAAAARQNSALAADTAQEADVPGERAFLLLDDGADVTEVTDSVERIGGRVLHVFPPSALIVDLPTNAAPPAGVQTVHRRAMNHSSLVSLSDDRRRAAELWNQLLADASSPSVLMGAEHLQAELVGDALVPPAPSQSLLSAQAEADAGDPTPDPTQTSEYMIGRVAVGIVLPESDGSVESSSENWTDEERGLVLSEITAALHWWAELEPRANLTFVYDDGTASPVGTGYEPIRHPYRDQSLWIGDVMEKKGYTGLSYFDQVRQYNHDLRETYDTDWAFTLFVIDSSEDGDNRFADGAFAYAYLGGPFAVLTSGSNGYGAHNLDAVAAHEIGHLFLALDQYHGAHQACDRRSGYLGVENQNSRYGDCASDEPSLMRGQVWPFRSNSLDQYARGQIGWRDSDGDGIFDPVDTAITLTSADYVTSATRSNVFTFTGEIRDEPYPSPLRTSVSINTIETVEYRVADGDWIDAEPGDQAFDSYAEDFSFTTRPLPTGDLDVELRVVDSAGNVLTKTLATVASVDPLDEVLETTLTRIGPQAMGQGATDVVYRGQGTSADSTFVAMVHYRIDDGEWKVVSAADGAFDEPEEDFTLAFSPGELSPGDHRIEVYAEDGDGNADTSPARDMLHVSATKKRLFLPLITLSP